jgi:hypothetical protein
LKVDRAYIITYRPENEAVFQSRREVHLKQIEYWRKQGLKFLICADNYRDEDYILASDIQYIRGCDYPHELHKPNIASARNALLSEFYKTDEDFGIFLDEDIILEAGFEDNDQFISNFRSNWTALNGIDAFTAATPAWTTKSRLRENRSNVYDKNFEFEWNPNMAGHLYAMRNFKKFYDTEYYFKESWCPTATGNCGEDVVFTVDLARAGLGVYTLNNITKQVACDDQSIWMADGANRKQMVLDFRKALAKAYDIPTTKAGTLKWDTLRGPDVPKRILIWKL